LVIGDTHLPFTIDGYLEFCKDMSKQYKCTRIIHIGDVVDNHAASFHDSDPDGMGAGDELELAITKLKKWYKAFPEADVILGNHCEIVSRKIFGSGLPNRWQRSFAEVLEVPKWKFSLKKEYDGVVYSHGLGVTARTTALRTGKSHVQGHRHSESYVHHHPRGKKSLFGMQVGTGINSDAYAFAYARNHPESAISCGVVLNNGTLPIVLPMPR